MAPPSVSTCPPKPMVHVAQSPPNFELSVLPMSSAFLMRMLWGWSDSPTTKFTVPLMSPPSMLMPSNSMYEADQASSTLPNPQHPTYPTVGVNQTVSPG